MKELKPFRQIISYHPTFGHLYVPGLKARIRHNDGPYFLVTDNKGFRNGWLHEPLPFGEKHAIVLGDSFTAGDGVKNEARFSDLLMQELNLKVTNLAVSGYGVDQQILVYEAIKEKIEHDFVIFAPHLDDLRRNMMDKRPGIDRETRKLTEIPKPYFTINDGQLQLKNQPVPRQRVINDGGGAEAVAPAEWKTQLARLKNNVSDFIYYKILNNSSDSDISDSNGSLWELMDALMQKLFRLTDGKPVFVVPVPEQTYIYKGENPRYLYPFTLSTKKYPNAKLIDILPDLVDAKKSASLFLNGCGHFTEYGHQIVAHSIKKSISTVAGVSERQKQIVPAARPAGFYSLGLSCLYHDSAAALVKDGKIIAAAQEERFTRIKHDKSFPSNAIHYCLEEAGIDAKELSGIAYYDDEALTLERGVFNALASDHPENFWKDNRTSLLRKLLLTRTIREELNYTGPVSKTLHHHSHAASAFYPSPFKEAAILVVDGVGEWACSSIGYGDESGVKMMVEQHYPHSLGLLYSAFTYFCGFKVNSGEYKLMGLAPYGQPRYTDHIYDYLIEVNEEGAIKLNLDYFSFQDGNAMVNEKFEALFGLPVRKPETRITRDYMDVGASIQKVTEEIMLKMVRYAHAMTNSENLVMAGGVALNCVANGKILKKGPFRHVWIQPAAGDAGGAIGAALEMYRHLAGLGSKRFPMDNAYLGPAFTPAEIQAFAFSKDIPVHYYPDKEIAEVVAKEIALGKIAGYFNGRMEFGPRALGARSIIGDPRNEKMQSVLNLKIKFRESFRPFAPAVLRDKCTGYFDIESESPFMLLVAPVKEELCYSTNSLNGGTDDMIAIVNQKRSDLPAITHVDYSARIQTVTPGGNGFFELLDAFDKLTGCPVLVNTSFNVRGEPIVCTPADAYRCFMRTGMDILVLGNYIMYKEEQPAFQETEKWQEVFELD